MKQQLRIAVDGCRQRRKIFVYDYAARCIAMHLTCVAQQDGGVEFARMEHDLSVEETRCAQQAVHDIGYPLHGTADARASICDIPRVKPLAHLDEALGMRVDDGQRCAEFMGGHGHEIALLSRQPPLVLESLLQGRGLLARSSLAAC